jgi:hypothetical protein
MDFCLGTRGDVQYTEFLPPLIARSVLQARQRLEPARIGWAVSDARPYTNCRRWILRSDTMQSDPFGGRTVRAMMHPGYMNPTYIGPAGPIDPDLSLLAAESADGVPLAVLANFSMHYFGGGGPADYFGLFAEQLARKLADDDGTRPMCLMSQGTSGDLHWMDYSRPRRSVAVNDYADALAQLAREAYDTMEFHDWVPLAMDEQLLTLNRRTPDEQRLAWARDTFDRSQHEIPRNRTEVYAQQAVYIHENPRVEIKLQALRIGQLGITALPNEVYGITGLKLKAQSPLRPTFNIELANGAAGYIPPPSQHRLGGYTTWPARTAGLEVQAEPRIVETLLASLEKISGSPRRPLATEQGTYARAVLAAKPLAYWRLSEMAEGTAADSSSHEKHATYQGTVAFFLTGPSGEAFSDASINRCAHFAGGQLQADLDDLGEEYTVSLWFWNGLPAAVRPVTGTLLARGSSTSHEALLIGGTSDPASAGKLVFRGGTKTFAGKTPLQVRRWHHVALIRKQDRAVVFLDGNPEQEIDATAAGVVESSQLFVAGHSRPEETFEGKIDEVAVFNRLLAVDELQTHLAAASVHMKTRSVSEE